MLHVAFDVSAPGVPDVTALIYDVRRGDPGAALLRGRLAAQPDEVAVGPATLEAMGLSVGDAVELSAHGSRSRFRIVGEVLFPEGDFSHDAGVAITLGGAGFLGGIDGTEIHQVAFSWAAGVDAGAADRALGEAGFQVFSTVEGVVPAVVSNLDEVRRLPGLLAALVLGLGLVTVAHAISQTTRLRQREAGTLRAIGVRPAVVAATVAAQGATAILLAVAVGLPLGLAAGRQLWSLVAARAHVVDRPVTSWAGLAATLALLLLMAVLLALPMAVRAARQRPAVALRAE